VKFELRSVKNGLTLKAWQTNDETGGHEEIVFQESYDESDEVERFADFLRTIDEYYGPSTGRYSPKRIYIVVKPGDKHEACEPEEDPR
jgi:hypothetical protein